MRRLTADEGHLQAAIGGWGREHTALYPSTRIYRESDDGPRGPRYNEFHCIKSLSKQNLDRNQIESICISIGPRQIADKKYKYPITSQEPGQNCLLKFTLWDKMAHHFFKK